MDYQQCLPPDAALQALVKRLGPRFSLIEGPAVTMLQIHDPPRYFEVRVSFRAARRLRRGHPGRQHHAAALDGERRMWEVADGLMLIVLKPTSEQYERRLAACIALAPIEWGWRQHR